MRRLRRVSAAATAATLAAIGAAQGPVTAPAGYAAVEGSARSSVVVDNDFRLTQTLYESYHVPRTMPWVSRLHLRPDGGGGSPYPASTRRLTVRMSALGVPSPELASRASFTANHGVDLTTVLTDRVVTFPSATPMGGPEPFGVTITLDVPFPLQGLTHLLVEVEAADEPRNTNPWPWHADAERWAGRGWTVLPSTFGSSCGAGATSYIVSFDAQAQTISATFRFARIGGIPNLPGLAWVGTSDQQWGPLPLPLRLGVLGAPNCSIYTDPSVTAVGTTTSNGGDEELGLVIPVPRGFGFLGRSIFTQAAVFDAAAGNAGDLRASSGARFVFSSPPDPLHALTLTRTGSPGDVPTEVMPNEALVLGMD